MSEFIPVNVPLLDGNEKKYINECLDTGWISSEGPFVKKFEELFARRIGRRFAVAVTNGSAALDAAVAAINVMPGDKVIMPAFTIISCAAAVVRAGGVPVLVDADPVTWNMDIEQLRSVVLTTYKNNGRIKAIMAVHIYGLPVDMGPLLELAAQYGIQVIEDAAEAHGQMYNGQPCGSFGDISTFSFYPNKHITTGEGGMIVTDNEDLYHRCLSLRNLFFDAERRYIHEELGWNLRMTNLQAALGVAQLETLDSHLAKKRRNGMRYFDRLKSVPSLQLPLDKTTYADNLFWVFGIVIKAQQKIDATAVMNRLSALKVGTRHFFWPLHLQPVLQKRGLFVNEAYPVAEMLARQGLYLPSGLALTDGQIDRVCDALKSIVL